MQDNQIHGAAEAVKLAAKRMSPRARKLAALERWVEGTQYDHLADWFEDLPIGEKAPCIVEPLVSDSIESHVDMVLGEGRFPAITTRPAEDESEDDESDEDGGLDEDDSAAVDKLILGASEQSRFRATCREALSMSMGCGSTCAIYGARTGKLFGDVVKARWCTPEFGDDGRTVNRLVIEYPYVETYQREDGDWQMRARVFRREIDDKSDITYKPGDASASKINWKGSEALKIEHGLGFCPVVWYPFMRGCTIVGVIDGRAPHENLTDEIHAYDVAMSQRHRAALYAGDPQWTEAGVEPGSNPSTVGKIKPMLVTKDGGLPRADNPVIGEYHGENAGRQPGRKKHPGTVWQYEDKGVKVQLHTLPGDALESLNNHAGDLRLKIMQALSYVPLDPESTKVMRGSLSGKALESLRERQLNRDDKIRDDFGDGFIKPSTSMLLRICHAKSSGLKVRGLKKAAPILARFHTEEAKPDAVAGS